jgi:tight adherence protein B
VDRLLGVGKSIVVDLPGEVKDVLVADPKIANAVLRTVRRAYLIGVAIGQTNIYFFDAEGRQLAGFDVIAIQQKSGGNLSEALGNLSKVVRDRKKMKGKIKAMSTEAKASAAIIGALPIAVMTIVYLTSPDYITLLWTTRLGQIMLAGSALWMSIGTLVMRQMINFDF